MTAPAQPAKLEQTPVAVAAPATAPVAVNVVQPPVITRYHSQDEFGQYAFGYSDGLANRDEVRDANGAVRGKFIQEKLVNSKFPIELLITIYLIA